MKPEEPAEIVSTPTVETKPVEPTPPVEEAPVEEKRLVDQLANMYTW